MGNAGSAPEQEQGPVGGAEAGGPPTTVRFFPAATQHTARQPPPIKLEEEDVPPPPGAAAGEQEEDMAPRKLWQVYPQVLTTVRLPVSPFIPHPMPDYRETPAKIHGCLPPAAPQTPSLVLCREAPSCGQFIRFLSGVFAC